MVPQYQPWLKTWQVGVTQVLHHGGDTSGGHHGHGHTFGHSFLNEFLIVMVMVTIKVMIMVFATQLPDPGTTQLTIPFQQKDPQIKDA